MLILFGMLFAWLLATAVMTYLAGIHRPRVMVEAAERGLGTRFAEASPEQAAFTATASAVDEAFKAPMDESASLPLIMGRRADQHVGPETASIAASFDSR